MTTDLYDRSMTTETYTRIFGEIRLLVRYADTDRMGIVYHARFLEYLEVGRVDLMKKTGLSYRSLEEQGVFFPLTEVWVRYRRSVTFDDEIVLKTWYSDLGPTRLTFAYRLINPSGELAVEALTMHAQVDRNFRPRPVDDRLACQIRPHLMDEAVGPTRMRWPASKDLET